MRTCLFLARNKCFVLIVSSDSEPNFERIFLTSWSFETDSNILSTTQDRSWNRARGSPGLLTKVLSAELLKEAGCHWLGERWQDLYSWISGQTRWTLRCRTYQWIYGKDPFVLLLYKICYVSQISNNGFLKEKFKDSCSKSVITSQGLFLWCF